MKTDKELAPILRVCQQNLTKAQYERLAGALTPDADLVAEHNKIMYDAYASLGMVTAGMSAVKGAPSAAKVAIWRDSIAAAQRTLTSLAPKGSAASR